MAAVASLKELQSWIQVIKMDKSNGETPLLSDVHSITKRTNDHKLRISSFQMLSSVLISK